MVSRPLVWITGAAGGIGQALMQAAVVAGYDVLGLDQRECALPTACATQDAIDDDIETEINSAVPPAPRVSNAVLDLSQSATVTQFCQQQTRLPQALIHAAGILHPASISASDDYLWRHTFAVNLDSAFYLCRTLLPHWQQHGHAAVVLIGSNAGQVPRLNMAAYSAAKAALRQFGRCLALELAGSGGRCNLVSPGSTNTPMLQQLWTEPTSKAATLRGDLAQFRLGIPLQRIASPQQIAQAALFLISNQASHITMQDLVVDGGASLGP